MYLCSYGRIDVLSRVTIEGFRARGRSVMSCHKCCEVLVHIFFFCFIDWLTCVCSTWPVDVIPPRLMVRYARRESRGTQLFRNLLLVLLIGTVYDICIRSFAEHIDSLVGWFVCTRVTLQPIRLSLPGLRLVRCDCIEFSVAKNQPLRM